MPKTHFLPFPLRIGHICSNLIRQSTCRKVTDIVANAVVEGCFAETIMALRNPPSKHGRICNEAFSIQVYR